MEAAKDLLKRAVELDTAQKYSEALICYEEGIQNLLRADCKTDGEKMEVRKKAESYLDRAEQLKQLVKLNEGPEERVQSIHIRDGDTGHSYASVFDRCLDGNVEWIEVDDPYVRARHQVLNLVRFCELAFKNCKRLKRVRLTTGVADARSHSEASQASSLRELQESLRNCGVKLDITYSQTLHDREIRFSNGWIVKLGRGLDYFQKPSGQFCIGSYDFDLRPCHETTIDIFHRLNTKTVKNTQHR